MSMRKHTASPITDHVKAARRRMYYVVKAQVSTTATEQCDGDSLMLMPYCWSLARHAVFGMHGGGAALRLGRRIA